jgi:hypothetical protein
MMSAQATATAPRLVSGVHAIARVRWMGTRSQSAVPLGDLREQDGNGAILAGHGEARNSVSIEILYDDGMEVQTGRGVGNRCLKVPSPLPMRTATAVLVSCCSLTLSIRGCRTQVCGHQSVCHD